MTSSRQHTVGDAPPLPVSQKLLYGLGYLPDVLCTNLLSTLAMMVYNVELGVSATWIGTALALPRLWEAITDPLIGTCSDRTRTRWGRRRPFMLVGAVGCGVLCMALWNPPAAWCTPGHDMHLLAYFTVASLLFLTSYALYSVPFLALGMGLTPSDAERTSLMSYRSASDQIARMTILAFLPAMVTSPMLGHTPLEAVGRLGILLGVLIAGLGLIAAVFSREPMTEAPPSGHATAVGLLDALRQRALLLVIGIVVFVLLGFILAVSLTYYLNLSVVFPGGGLAQKQAATQVSGIAQSVSSIIGLGFCALVPRLAARWGRRQVLTLALSALLGIFLASPLVFAPDRPWWVHVVTQTTFQSVLAVSLVCVWILTLPMLAEVCDHDALVHGVRREGVFTALFQWGGKLAGALIMVANGVMIDGSHFRADAAWQTPETITYLRTAFALTPVPFLLAALWCHLRFPLTPALLDDLRRQRTTPGSR